MRAASFPWNIFLQARHRHARSRCGWRQRRGDRVCQSGFAPGAHGGGFHRDLKFRCHARASRDPAPGNAARIAALGMRAHAQDLLIPPLSRESYRKGLGSCFIGNYPIPTPTLPLKGREKSAAAFAFVPMGMRLHKRPRTPTFPSSTDARCRPPGRSGSATPSVRR